MKTKRTIICGLFAVIIAVAFTVCDDLGKDLGNEDPDGTDPSNVNGTDPDNVNGGGPGDGSQAAHTHQWGAWTATELTGTEERVCADNPAHIEARLTGTTRFTFEAISGAAAYSVSKGTAIIGTVRIPAYYRPSAEVEFHPVAAIGGNAFRDCTSLTNIDIPETVTSIGSSAFSGCIILTNITIPASVTEIGYSAFSGCTSFTNVTIPASVTTIGDSAFSDCSSLTDITVDSNNPNYANQDGILYNKAKTFLIQVPGAISGTVTIPAGVMSIGGTYIFVDGDYIRNGTFSGCTGLTSVTFAEGSHLQTIGDRAFSNCASLTSITIPASVTEIGYEAFSGCTGLTNITIPTSVTTIGNVAFSGCTSLTNITIPATVTYIGGRAFYGWSNTQTIYVPWSLGNRPNGWNSQWNLYCYAQIVYQGE
jgi:hypothetical protein